MKGRKKNKRVIFNMYMHYLFTQVKKGKVKG